MTEAGWDGLREGWKRYRIGGEDRSLPTLRRCVAAEEVKGLAEEREERPAQAGAIREREEAVRSDPAYEAAMRRALARLDRGADLRRSRPASRDELHERDGPAA